MRRSIRSIQAADAVHHQKNATLDNAARLTRLLLDGFGGGDMSVLDEVVASDFIEHQPGMPQGRDGLKQVIRTLRQSFPDLNYSAVHMVRDGSMVWGHFRGRGTNTGRFMGQTPTGKTIDIDVIDIARFEGGMMVEHWGVPDRFTLLAQLGLFLPAGGWRPDAKP